MKTAALILTLVAVTAHPMSISDGGEGYEDSYREPSYEGGKQCKYEDQVSYKEKCEEYNDHVCYYNHYESCEDVYDKTCRATVSTKEERYCTKVNETTCTLKEEVKFDVIDAVYTVLVCTPTKEKVCDYYYEMDYYTTSEKTCIDVPTFVCKSEEKTVYDKTCHSITKYDCEYDNYGENYGYDESTDNYKPGYKNSKGYENKECKTRKEQKCSTTPRLVTTQHCYKHVDKVCEKISETRPKPIEKQNCRYEDKKYCRVEKKTQPKQIKKYYYTKVCKPYVKDVCENYERKYLVPACVPTTRKNCVYKPTEKCEDIPKKYCYKVPYTTRVKKCYDEKYPESEYPETYTETYDDEYRAKHK